MPILPSFSAKIDPAAVSGGRRAAATDFGPGPTDVGQAIQQGAHKYLTSLEEDESRKVVVAGSEIRAKYAKALDQAATDGSDLDALKQKMSDDLAKVGENFQTKKGRDALSINTSNSNLMFDEQANHIAVQRATITARLQGHAFLNSTAALLQSNPGYLSIAEGDADALGKTFSKISPEKRLEIVDGLKKELNMAAAMAAARIDPEGTKKKLDGGSWNLTVEQRNTALNKADTEIRAKRADETYQRAQQEYDERKLDDGARDKHFAGIMDGTATRRGIMDDADLKPTTREHLIALMEHRAKELTTQEKKSDPVVVRDLWLRIHAADDDPRKIYTGDAIFNAVNDGKINTTDANGLNILVANQKDENNKSIGQRLGGMVSVVGRALSQDPRFVAQPALVAEIQNDYQARVFDKVKEMRDAQKNPSDLFNPASKEYVGSREFIQASIDAAHERQRAAMPKIPDLRKEPTGWKQIEVGSPFVDPKGQTRTMTKELKAALSKGDGGTSARDDYDAWMQATGGLLKAGQNVDQAVAEWKAKQ